LSLCIVLTVSDSYIVIGADSRGCTLDENGNYIDVNDNYENISAINNNVIFCNGDKDALDYIKLKFKQSENQNINTLQQICIETYETFKHINNFPPVVNICIATLEESKVALYYMSSKDENFEIKRYSNDRKKVSVMTFGFNQAEATILTESYLKEHSEFTISELYKYVYQELVDENTIGGRLTIYTLLSGRGIRRKIIQLEG